jgi:hypothetical protein
MPAPLKAVLEDLLRTRRLQTEGPPLRGERRLFPLATGVAALDALLGGGFPRGKVSEVYGPRSSGRTGLLLSLLARVTRGGPLAAWVDTADRLDPTSAHAAGVDLERLFWLRGTGKTSESLSAAATLLGSGLFELLVLDLAELPDLDRLPGTTWLRFHRMIEDSTAALVILGDRHTPHGPTGVSLAFREAKPFWSGRPGPGHLFQGLSTEVRVGREGRVASLDLRTPH